MSEQDLALFGAQSARCVFVCVCVWVFGGRCAYKFKCPHLYNGAIEE